jgi:excisionase family DNA binding protein
VTFGQFVRLPRDLAGSVRGSGLGLYICKNLVEAMGEHIWVESSDIAGEGSASALRCPARNPTRPIVSFISHIAFISIILYDRSGIETEIYQKEVTTQEAADILNVSRPYLIKMLEEEKIPYVTVGSHRRIPLQPLLEYKERRDEEREQGLRELTQLSQELGLYDE